MPASTVDPVNAALRTALSRRPADNCLDFQLAGSAKKALLTDIEFESAGSYQSSVLDKLKSKYIVLKSEEAPEASEPEEMGADEMLILAKHELFPLSSVQLGWSNATDWTVGAGMVNMGNTCYLNSTLQAIFHVPSLVNWLLSDKQHMAECEDAGGLCIICAVRKTLQDSQQRNVNSIRPFLIYNKLRVVCRHLIPGRQEDAHEFLRYLVEAMERAYLSRFKNHSEFDSRTKETTPLNQILGGYLRSMVRCLECGHVSTTFQHFQDLLLDIRKVQTLDEALEGYFSREKLDDITYQCDSCKKKVPATKQFSLERAPMVLCIQLKRFSVSNNKITKHLQFRQRLDITRFTRRRPTLPLVYRLVALVTHMGPTVSCGHYTAVAQAPSGGFYQFDDSMVKPISHQAVFGTNAYIMLYELECLPSLPKSSTIVNSSTKFKTTQPNNTSTKSAEQLANSQAPHVNGNLKVYGPELPPTKSEKSAVNGQSSSSVPRLNGNKKHSGSSSSESDGELTPEKSCQKESKQTVTNSISNSPSKSFSLSCDKSAPDAKSPSRVLMLPGSSMPCLDRLAPLTPNSTSESSDKISKQQTSGADSSNAQPATKLVPYDMDDSSSCSEESPTHMSAGSGSRVSTKAAVGEWKVTSASDVAQEPSSEGKSWDKKKVQSERSTVNELLRMSHGGYAAPVSSWNGTRAQLDKEISNERREERKRMMLDNSDQGRVKHPRLNNGTHKSNPGYNPIQEYHNARNWAQNNGPTHYRQFYNDGNRHRNNRRNFHNNKHYHKSYRFRQ